MSTHIYGNIVTHHGAAANNRGENDGNITTLQKLLWKGNVHTTVSSEAIRWAIRYFWQLRGLPVNRVWNPEKDTHEWKDEKWTAWAKGTGETFIDDDVLGFMKAEGAKAEGGKGEKGHADKRRGVLEVARAVSTTPFAGDITFNAKSGFKERTSLYGTEVHATRYQYGFAFTPDRLRDAGRAAQVLEAICNLGEVAGNHSRFLFDFSPESVVLRLTDDPAPRLLFCMTEQNDEVQAGALIDLLESKDVKPEEIYVGGLVSKAYDWKKHAGVHAFAGVKDAFAALQADLAKRK
ncbi:MAG: type I-B CRISPR-associated protein Cas7/Cst2/DevR [Deltaproteobacteria bacterium HGW-Deltaproteobacteria-22]|jgi:CRISPR-associated protein Cst2|nr:MAG: type I-B CRISPR-associated protein Cas7/Cst2/DevR [Deltaproteobacteria bacterium HGW-Deltaproteobacteria-22]